MMKLETKPMTTADTGRILQKLVLDSLESHGLAKVIKPWSRQELELERPAGFTSIHLEFEDSLADSGRTEWLGASLYIRLERDPSEDDNTTAEDAEGNLYHKMQLSCTVNHPSYGPRSVRVVRAFKDLLDLVLGLAEFVEGHPSLRPEVGIWNLWRTKAQLDEIEAKHKAERIEAKCRDLVTTYGKGMRIGSTALVVSEVSVGIPDGYRYAAKGGKRYTVIQKPAFGSMSAHAVLTRVD